MQHPQPPSQKEDCGRTAGGSHLQSMRSPTSSASLLVGGRRCSTRSALHAPAVSVISAPACLYMSSLKVEAVPAPLSILTLKPASVN